MENKLEICICRNEKLQLSSVTGFSIGRDMFHTENSKMFLPCYTKNANREWQLNVLMHKKTLRDYENTLHF